MAGLGDFVGKWEEDSKEGFDEMIGELSKHLPQDVIEMYKNTKTGIAYQLDGDTWTINVSACGTPLHREFKFKLGESYTSADLDGSRMKSLVKSEGNTLVEDHTYEEGKLKDAQMHITRCIENNVMVVETKMFGGVIKARYKRV